MPIFSYRARDSRGILVTGYLESAAIEQLKEMLADQGLIPVSIKETRVKGSWIPEFQFFKPVKDEEIVLMTRQFHTLFKAGMSMEMILSTLSKQTRNKAMKETLQRIQTDISQGASLSKAFSKHPRVFNELYVNMLATGEEAGILEEVLRNLADLIQKEIEIEQGVKAATMYPKIVCFVLFWAIVGMLVYVLPKFQEFYSHYDAPLPLPTRILTAASTALRSYGPLVLLAFGGIFMMIRRYYQTPVGKLHLDGIRWKIPVFGVLGQKIANARYAHIMAALYSSGFAITRSLKMVENVIGNEVMAKELRHIQMHIERGQSISEAMQETKTFTPILIEATAIGEKTGSLDVMLKGLAEHFDADIKHMIKNLTTLLEPILLFFIFGVVALFALAIFLPMLNLSTVVLGH